MGARFWYRKDIRYDQTTKIIEYFLQDLKAQKNSTFWLQSCNVCASCVSIEAVGAQFKVKIPTLGINKFMSQADIMFCLIYSKFGRDMLPVKPVVGIVESEIMENLSFIIKAFSTAKTINKYFKTNLELVESMKRDLNNGSAITLSYLTDYNSGHYISVVNWDGSKFFAYDSWADNIHCQKGGVLEEYSPEFFIKRARPRYIEVFQ